MPNESRVVQASRMMFISESLPIIIPTTGVLIVLTPCMCAWCLPVVSVSRANLFRTVNMVKNKRVAGYPE
jgi:hypothetical protein